MRGQADTCTARLAAVLDEASTAGSSAEPYWCGRLMNDLYPDRREAVRPHGGSCPARALSAHMARCSRYTPPRGRNVPPRPRSWSMTCSESAAAPARLDCKSEQFPTILSHLLMQLACHLPVLTEIYTVSMTTAGCRAPPTSSPSAAEQDTHSATQARRSQSVVSVCRTSVTTDQRPATALADSHLPLPHRPLTDHTPHTR